MHYHYYISLALGLPSGGGGAEPCSSPIDMAIYIQYLSKLIVGICTYPTIITLIYIYIYIYIYIHVYYGVYIERDTLVIVYLILYSNTYISSY